MAKKAKKANLRTDADEVPAETRYQQTSERDKELANEAGVEEACLEVLKDVVRGFTDQWERSNQCLDNWDMFNCALTQKQFYSGNSKIYVPIVHDAVEARKTRFVNQLFPVSGKHVEVVASEEKPTDLQSLIEFYIRKAKLRTRVFPALVRNGDVEGQYNVMLHWVKNKRHVVKRVKKQQTMEEVVIDKDDTYDDIEEDTIVHQYPSVEVLPDNDVLIIPATADSIEEALDAGGSVTVIRRWSKSKINQMIEDGEIDSERGEIALEAMAQRDAQSNPDKKSAMVSASGARAGEKGKHALIYNTWTKLKIGDERRIVKIYFAASGGEDKVVSCKLNPFWCDKVPILSASETKLEGSFKGKPKVNFVETMQYAANDAINEGMDSAAYALLPIIMTDPVKNPRTGTMVLNVAAIWETNPKDTQFAQFPQLWKEAFAIVNSSKDQIFQTLGINPAMMPQQAMAPGKKPNQAMIANEQQVDILTTADAVTTLEGEICSPLLQWFVYLDHQFRDEEITIRAFGEMGLHAMMETIEPIQMDRRFEFRWFGVEAARNLQQMQMQMSALNVIRNLPPQMYPGHELNLTPVIAQFVENLFGPRMAAQIFTDIRSKLTLPVEFENELLEGGYDIPTQPMDNDQEHMQAHAKLLQEHGDPTGVIRVHMMRHQQQMQQKQQAMAMQQAQVLQGGGQQQGGPKPGGAQAGPRRQAQGPAGMVRPDNMGGQGPMGPRTRAA